MSHDDYLPARMLNEFVYCPRLFYYEWVEGVFADNRETVEGSLRHRKLDSRQDALPTAEQLAAQGAPVRARSVTLSSDTYGLIAKIDLLEGSADSLVPVDYKRGAPRERDDEGTLQAWDTDRAQLCAQAMILRDNGYSCDEGVIYYCATKQRVRVAIDHALVQQTLELIAQARQAAASDTIPPPLVDSPKCPRCSLVGICLPDETSTWRQASEQRDGDEPRYVQKTLFDVGPTRSAELSPRAAAERDVRRLVPARDDLRPLYLNTQGLYVGKSGHVLKVKEKEKLVQEVRIGEICQVNLFGNIQLSTQAIQSLCEAEVPIAYYSQGGWFYGLTRGHGLKNIFLRREQFRWADVPSFCLRLARALVAGKIRNQRTLLQRNHVEPPAGALAQMKCMQEDAEHAATMEELLGIEGNAARVYFSNFSGMLKQTENNQRDTSGADVERGSDPDPSTTDNGGGGESRSGSGSFTFDFTARNRRPPRDPVNAMLSLAYSVLAKDLTIVCQAVGFDPYLGFYHQPRFGRPSLALDLMEPFRPLIADSAVLTAANTRMVSPVDFVRAGESVALTAEGRKAFFRAYEQRIDTLVTHPLFGYRVSYRRLLEIQTRLLARLLTGEVASYPVFTTR